MNSKRMSNQRRMMSQILQRVSSVLFYSSQSCSPSLSSSKKWELDCSVFENMHSYLFRVEAAYQAVSFSVFVYILWQDFMKGSAALGILINQGSMLICPKDGDFLFLKAGYHLCMGVPIPISLSDGYQDSLWL